jgi:hypothetical protein
MSTVTAPAKSMNIYEITQDALRIYQQIMANDGELTPELEEEMQITEANLTQKAKGYGYVILHNGSQMDAVDAEIKRLQAIKKTRQRLEEKLKERILNTMLILGKDRIEADTITFSIRKSEAVEILDEAYVPNEYKIYEPKINKLQIKAALKEGQLVAGAHLITNQNLQIK